MARVRWHVFAYMCDGDGGNCTAISREDENEGRARSVARDADWVVTGHGDDDDAFCPAHRHEAPV